jgi:hypothetical protein
MKIKYVLALEKPWKHPKTKDVRHKGQETYDPTHSLSHRDRQDGGAELSQGLCFWHDERLETDSRDVCRTLRL